jgi:hypothetical protein
MNRATSILKASAAALFITIIVASCTISFGDNKHKEGVVFCDSIGKGELDCEGKSSTFQTGDLYARLTTKKKFNTDQVRATIYILDGKIEREVDSRMLDVDPDWNTFAEPLTLNSPGKYKVTFVNKEGKKMGEGKVTIEGDPIAETEPLEAKLQFCTSIGEDYACDGESTVFSPGKLFVLLSLNQGIGVDRITASFVQHDAEGNPIGEPKTTEITVQPEWDVIAKDLTLEEAANYEIAFTMPDGTELAKGVISIYAESAL